MSLTTTHASDVIIVACDCWPVGGPFSVKDTAGLTFVQRTAQLSIGGNQFIQEWYAVAPSPLAGDSISVQTSVNGHTWYGVIAFGVSGANTASPFDTNPSLPRVQANINCPGSIPCNTGVSTTNNPDFVFQFGGDTEYTIQTAGAGLTLIQSNVAGQTAYAQYEIAANTLSSATLAFGTPQGRDFGVIADAIRPGPATSMHSTTTSVTPNPSSVLAGSSIVFTATVTDTSGSPSTPTGTMTWSDGGVGGSFSSSSACTLSPAGPSSATCQITYTAPSTPGLITISGIYSDDSIHSASTGTSMLTITSASTGTDWPSFTLNNQDSRYQANSTITSSNVGQITQKWVIDTPLSITSTPVTLAGSIYFADWGGNVYSASIATGHLNWKVNLGSNPITSTLALANGMVYVGDGINATKVFALSQTDGHTMWVTSLHPADGNPGDTIWSSPILYNGMIYIGVASNGLKEDNASQRGEIFALNSITGNVAWGFVTGSGSAGGDSVWGSVAIDPALNSIYFATGNPFGSGSGSSTLYGYAVVSLDATTGSLKWYYQTYTDTATGGDQDFGSSPNLFSFTFQGVVHNAVGVGNKDGSYYVLDRATGQFLEKIKVGIGEPDGDGIIGVAGFIYQSPNNPEVFVPSYNEQTGGYFGVVKAITPSNGAIAWQFNTPLIIRGSVSVIPGAVLFGDERGNIYAVSTSSGTQLWHTSVAGSTDAGVTAAEGMIFVSVDGSGDGSGGQGALYAFG
ncbi:MAG: PQQ-binding-like beta-propeller repeat protein [Thaumarchaeota archaeon]|nr:PQQ-binding-like beta-propeller repeat protein [Nitrososphaerota archaeon]